MTKAPTGVGQRIGMRSNRESKQVRWHWLFLAPAILLVLCAFGAFLWWHYYKTTPTYTLALLVDAAERNDTTAFDELFVMDRVVETFASEMAQAKGVDSPEWLRNRLVSIAPSITATIKPIFREAVRRRILELAEQSANAPFFLRALGVLLKTNVVGDGSTATATISQGGERLELKLEQVNKRWKVVSVRDDALASRVMANLTKELPVKIPTDGIPNPLDGLLPKTLP